MFVFYPEDRREITCREDSIKLALLVRRPKEGRSLGDPDYWTRKQRTKALF